MRNDRVSFRGLMCFTWRGMLFTSTVWFDVYWVIVAGCHLVWHFAFFGFNQTLSPIRNLWFLSFFAGRFSFLNRLTPIGKLYILSIRLGPFLSAETLYQYTSSGINFTVISVYNSISFRIKSGSKFNTHSRKLLISSILNVGSLSVNISDGTPRSQKIRRSIRNMASLSYEFDSCHHNAYFEGPQSIRLRNFSVP